MDSNITNRDFRTLENFLTLPSERGADVAYALSSLEKSLGRNLVDRDLVEIRYRLGQGHQVELAFVGRLAVDVQSRLERFSLDGAKIGLRRGKLK